MSLRRTLLCGSTDGGIHDRDPVHTPRKTQWFVLRPLVVDHDQGRGLPRLDQEPLLYTPLAEAPSCRAVAELEMKMAIYIVPDVSTDVGRIRGTA